MAAVQNFSLFSNTAYVEHRVQIYAKPVTFVKSRPRIIISAVNG